MDMRLGIDVINNKRYINELRYRTVLYVKFSSIIYAPNLFKMQSQMQNFTVVYNIAVAPCWYIYTWINLNPSMD